MSESIFKSMPEIPQEDIDWVKNGFTNYLFFETVEKGVRKYTCSVCGNTFNRGKNVKFRTETENDRSLSVARVGEVCTCPSCGKRLEVKNAKRCNLDKLSASQSILFCLPVNENEVWFRGITFHKSISKKTLTVNFEQSEYYRYRLVPGEARMWRKDCWSGTLYEPPTITDAFSWNHGYFCEKDYYFIYYSGHHSLSGTFLKYNGYETYAEYFCYDSVSFIKYLCWYAQHPQIEMLVKIGHVNIVNEMMQGNTDNRRLLNWEASTPWELMRLTHTEYNEYVKLGSDLDLLKTYHRIGGKGVKDFSKAKATNNFLQYSNWPNNKVNHKAIISVQAIAKREGKTAFEAIKYFEKISRDSAGACHHCPGITAKEAYNLWADYIEMLKAVNPKLKNVPLFPHDLKKRHDELLKGKKRKAAKDKVKAQKEYIKSLVEKYKKFNKVTEICKEITEKYSFTDSEYSIIVPQSIEEIIKESVALDMCIHRVENGRYFDRIQRRETYILFLRKNKNINEPWYIIETEPNGTVQQKRTANDDQFDDDIKAFTPFLRKWQEFVQTKLTADDITLARKSKQLREENFADLRKTKKQVNYGNHRGELLIDLLEKDLLEVIAG